MAAVLTIIEVYLPLLAWSPQIVLQSVPQFIANSFYLKVVGEYYPCLYSQHSQ